MKRRSVLSNTTSSGQAAANSGFGTTLLSTSSVSHSSSAAGNHYCGSCQSRSAGDSCSSSANSLVCSNQSNGDANSGPPANVRWPRRPLRSRGGRFAADSILGSSSVVYLKLVILWLIVFCADHLADFRFEFIWPFWLFVRSVYDSFKYQGMAFSVFFVCIAVTSDMVCYLFIPVHWLLFAASTYVWVQYVWQTERSAHSHHQGSAGMSFQLCLPTLVLSLIFVYIEAAVRLKDTRLFSGSSDSGGAAGASRTIIPFQFDLCRPFAAHCIGYPVVTLGFGVKSYISHRMRKRRQRSVRRQNDVQYEMLRQALPAGPTRDNAFKSQSYDEEDDDSAHEVDQGHGERRRSDDCCSVDASVRGSVQWDQQLPRRQSLISRTIDFLLVVTKVFFISAYRAIKVCCGLSCSSGVFTTSTLAPNNSICSTPCSKAGDHEPGDSGVGDNGNKKLCCACKMSVSDSSTSATAKLAEGSKRDPIKSKSDKLAITSTSTVGPTVQPMQSQHSSQSSAVQGTKVPSSALANGGLSIGPLGPTSTSGTVSPGSVASAGGSITASGSTSAPGSSTTPMTTTTSASCGGGGGGPNIAKMEADLKRYKVDLQISRNKENELRDQIMSFMSSERHLKSEMSGLQMEKLNLEKKISDLTSSRSEDKSHISSLDKRLAEERKLRVECQQKLEAEKRKISKGREAANAERTAHQLQSKTEVMKLEAEIKTLRQELVQMGERLSVTEAELVVEQRGRSEHGDPQRLAARVGTLTGDVKRLEQALAAEAKLKVDLFAAIGEAKQQLNGKQNLLNRQEEEIVELKSRLALVQQQSGGHIFTSSSATSLASAKMNGLTTSPSSTCSSVTNGSHLASLMGAASPLSCSLLLPHSTDFSSLAANLGGEGTGPVGGSNSSTSNKWSTMTNGHSGLDQPAVSHGNRLSAVDTAAAAGVASALLHAAAAVSSSTAAAAIDSSKSA